MKKYEYMRSIRAGFEPLYDTGLKLEVSGKFKLERLSDLIQLLELSLEVLDELRTHLSSEENITNDKELLEASVAFINKFIDGYNNTQKMVLFSNFIKRNKETLNITADLIERLQLSVFEIIDGLKIEVEKPQPNQSKVGGLLKMLKFGPEIEYKNKRMISPLSFLSEVFRNLVFINQKWEKFVGSGQDVYIEILTNEILDSIYKRQEYLKASFNRATVNKSYTSQDVQKILKDISEEMNKPLDDETIQELKESLQKVELIIEKPIDMNLKSATIQEVATALKKLYKNKIKKKFNKDIEDLFDTQQTFSIKTIEGISELWSYVELIFDTKDQEFNRYFINYLSEKSQHLTFKKELKDKKKQEQEITEEQKEKLTTLAQEAGAQMTNLLRRAPSEFIKIKNQIAQSYGRLKAKKNNLDNSRFFLSHFALLAFENEKEFNPEYAEVIFVPSIILKKKELYRKFNLALRNNMDNLHETHTVFELHSLTFDALKNKLIAKNVSELLPLINTEKNKEEDIVKVLKIFLIKFFDIKVSKDVYFKLYNDLGKLPRINSTYYLPIEFKNLIRDYVIYPRHDTIEVFREALESNYYFFEQYRVNLPYIIEVLKGFVQEVGTEEHWANREKLPFIGKVYFDKIQNRRYIEDFDVMLQHLKRGEFKVRRLNPEVTIYSEAREENEQKKNRKSRDRFFIQFVYTDHEPGEQFTSRFREDEEYLQELERFNEFVLNRFGVYKQQGKYLRVGVDVGTGEFVSMAFFSDWKVDRDIQKEGLPFKLVTIYRLKNVMAKAYAFDSGKEVILYQNPSVFIHPDKRKRAFVNKEKTQRVDPGDYLEAVRCHYLESSSLKIISNKIILNGDIVSYLKLQLIPAIKKMIRDNVDFTHTSIHVSKNKLTFQISGHDYPTTFSEEISVISEKDIQEIIKNILYNIKQKIAEVKNIDDYLGNLENTLQKNIASNIAGVCAYLMKESEGMAEFFVESEKEAFLIDHESKKFSSNRPSHSVSREFVWALLRRMQKFETTPPTLNRQYFIRQINLHSGRGSKSAMRYGNVQFIAAEGTSVMCPICLQVRTNENGKPNKNVPCANCGFDLKTNNYNIPNADILAACNIANPNFTEHQRIRNQINI